MPHRIRAHRVVVTLSIVVTLLHAAPAVAVSVYGDSLASGWQDWSWGGITRTFAQPTPVHSGGAAIAVTFTGAWSGLQLGRPSPLDLAGLDTLRFFVHGGSAGGQHIEVQIGNHGSGAFVVRALDLQAESWVQIDVPLAALGAAATIDYIHWFNATAAAQAATATRRPTRTRRH